MARRTFRSLRVRNYRLYFLAQIVSVSGTWMQSIGLAWLVLRLTGSGVDLGAVTAMQFVPVLVAGAWGGVVADRVDKRRLLFGTQAGAGVLALALGLLTALGDVKLWLVYLLAGLMGCVRVIDTPARQAFVLEMVGPADLANAVSLNSVVMNSARIVGPAVAGALISTVGLAPCFLVNAASYLAVIAGLALMRTAELVPHAPLARARGQLRDGLRHVWSTPELRSPLLAMVVIGTLTYEFTVTLPLLARFSFHGGAGVLGAMYAFMSGGAVVGGLVVAHRARPTPRALAGSALAFGLFMLGVSMAPVLPLELALLVPMGAASIAFTATANSTLQLRSDPAMRGRVMALYGVAFLGSTPIGAPIVGAVAQVVNPRAAVALGAVAALVVGAFLGRGVRASGRQPDGEPASALRQAHGGGMGTGEGVGWSQVDPVGDAQIAGQDPGLVGVSVLPDDGVGARIHHDDPVVVVIVDDDVAVGQRQGQ